ncbi:hypothetical protein ACHAW5_005357 [Stephanodiscus triporus]|uniref:Transmembrane protein n=1 Tax=Stephanodiscus triporus TaxID=2934178 RepID=A0ABD3NB50_9STRA
MTKMCIKEPEFCVGGLLDDTNTLLSNVDRCRSHIKSEARLRPNSIQSLSNSTRLLFILVLVTLAVERSFFVGADSMVVIAESESESIDEPSTIIVQEENGDDSQEGNAVEPGPDIPADGPVQWPASLVKAAQVGAKIGDIPKGQTEQSTDVDRQESEMNSPNAKNNVEGAPHNPKMLTGCHWGTMGCKKGKWNSDDINSSSAENNSDTGLAGSASARIDARVLKGRGPSLIQRRPASTRSVPETDDAESDRKAAGHEPPQGFRLAGRIVTSPSDGLSYFLDAPQVDPGDSNGDWMMTIPYRYLECGPTIESTTEAFPLTDMVLRHFPHSATMGHWMNLGGGVTIENVINEGEDGEGTRYFDTDANNEGHPKLLVALSPIEITVSGNNEESRLFNPGDVILMEDTLGKGHKMNAAPVIYDKAQHSKKTDAHGQDLFVIMVSLPHTVHLPIYDWLEESSYIHETSSSSAKSFASSLPSTPDGTDNVDIDLNDKEKEAERALLGFAPKHLHHKHRKQRKRSSLAPESKKPCPLEYDSVYTSLFIPAHNQYKRLRRSRSHPHRGEGKLTKDSSVDEARPPPLWFSDYENYLPSLRRTMLVGLGLSLTSSFVYCVQLLYPPLLALWGGAAMILGGAIMNVLVTRWSYRRFVADWLEEWRWRREVRRNRMHRKESMIEQEVIDGDTLQSIKGLDTDDLFVSDN